MNQRPSARQADVELGIGNLQASARIKVADIQKLLEGFKECCLIDMKKSKRTTYEKVWYIRKFLKWLKDPSQPITGATIREYLKTLNTVSEATYKNCLGALKTFFRDYLQMPQVVQGFKFPKQQFKPKRIPTNEQVRTFYYAIRTLKQTALYLVYASSGLRRNEVLGLTMEDVDFEKRMIRPGMHSGDTKKAWISFYNEETAKVLNEYLEGRNDGKLFPMARATERKLWHQAKKKTGLKITPQMLREWFCEEMGRLGVQDRYIDAFCGRIPKSVLTKHYSDYSPEKLKDIYDKAGLKVLAFQGIKEIQAKI